MRTTGPSPTAKPHAKPGHIRVPAFVPVPRRGRRDGWGVARQAAFLVALAREGEVRAAAKAVGMARETAYRLRRARGAEGFAAAWDAVLARARGRMKQGAGNAAAPGAPAPRKRKVTRYEAVVRALAGAVQPRVWRGAYAGYDRKPSACALIGYLARLDAALARAGGEGAGEGDFEGAWPSTPRPVRRARVKAPDAISW